MEDRDLMESELLIIKGACELYQHGAVESASPDVHTAFKDALNETLNIQNKIYSLMAEKGWYKTEPVEQAKINQTRQQFLNPQN